MNIGAENFGPFETRAKISGTIPFMRDFLRFVALPIWNTDPKI